tara:strand:- start:3355 stop:3528 length:174 start_codon:yes stop_codon:yes gene_type:complete
MIFLTEENRFAKLRSYIEILSREHKHDISKIKLLDVQKFITQGEYKILMGIINDRPL